MVMLNGVIFLTILKLTICVMDVVDIEDKERKLFERRIYDTQTFCQNVPQELPRE